MVKVSDSGDIGDNGDSSDSGDSDISDYLTTLITSPCELVHDKYADAVHFVRS